MDRKRIYKWGGLLLVTLVAVLLLGYFWQTELQITGGVLGAPLDDAWIHFQFARNISHGQGFSYNPGEPTPGSTAPLWTVILAVAGLLKFDFLGSALLLSALFMLVAVWLAYGFAYWITRTVWTALFAGLAVAFAGRMLWAGLAGMETTAFAALSLAAIWAYSRWGLRWFVALFFALASQLRPEGHALFALVLVDAGWVWWRENRTVEGGWLRSLLRRFLIPLALYVLIATPYGLFSLAVTGRPFPNTFYAKVGSQYLFSWRTLRETAVWHWQDNPVGLLLALLGLWPLWRRSRLAVLWLLGLPLFTALIVDFTWHHGRYTLPLIPLQMVAAATGAHWFMGSLVERVSGVWQARIAKGAPVLFIALLLMGGIWRLNQWATMLGNNVREIEEIDVALGEWLKENTASESLIAVDDIGAIAFISGRRIIDMNGLVSPEVWPASRAEEGLPRSQVLTRILSAAQPDFMVAFPLWRWDIATNAAVSNPVHHVETGTKTIIFQQDAFVYETSWPYVLEADPDYKMDARFGEGIMLLGYDLKFDNPLELVLYWKSESAVSESYDIFLHLLNESEDIVTQVDRKPVDGLAATDVWQPDEVIRDPVTISLPDDLPAGSYELRLGVYLRDSGERLEVQGGKSIKQALILKPIIIP